MWGLAKRDLDLIQTLAQNYPALETIIIFGSRAMGNYKPGSDVDLAIKGAVSSAQIREISGLLNDELPTPYFYDVLALDALTNPELLAHIRQYGQILYEKNPSQ